MFRMRSFVRPITFRPMPISSREPVNVSSASTA